MSAEANEAQVRRFLQAIDDGTLDVFDEIFSPDCVWHMPRGLVPKDLSRDEYKAFVGGVTASLSDIVHGVQDIVTEGDKTVFRNTVTAKHTGDFQGSPPTGKTVRFGGIGICQFRDGQIVEYWVEADFLGLMQQVGVVPAPAVAS